MDVERVRRGADRAAAAEELLERRQEIRRAPAVVLGEPGNRVAIAVSPRALERHPEEVLVRAELVVGHDSGLAPEHGRPEERVARLLEPRWEAREAAARVRDADGDGWCPAADRLAERLDERRLARARD